MPLQPTEFKNLDRKMEEGKLILEFIAWLKENKPLPPAYDYMFTIHNRLSPNPVVAVYVIPSEAQTTEAATGGFNIAMPTQWDILDGIKYLWNELKNPENDLRQFIEEDPGQ